jgi:hypothetical protein
MVARGGRVPGACGYIRPGICSSPTCHPHAPFDGGSASREAETPTGVGNLTCNERQPPSATHTMNILLAFLLALWVSLPWWTTGCATIGNPHIPRTILIPLSLGQAAKAPGMDTSTISRAMKSGKRSATRQEQGGYAIDPAAWLRVCAPASPDTELPVHVRDTALDGGSAHQALRLPLEAATLRVHLEATTLRIREKDEERRGLRHRLDTAGEARRKRTVMLLASHHAEPPRAYEQHPGAASIPHPSPPIMLPVATASATPKHHRFWPWRRRKGSCAAATAAARAPSCRVGMAPGLLLLPMAALSTACNGETTVTRNNAPPCLPCQGERGVFIRSGRVHDSVLPLRPDLQGRAAGVAARPCLLLPTLCAPRLGARRHGIPTIVGAWTIKPTRLQRGSIRIHPVTQPEITPSRADMIPRLVPVRVLTACCMCGPRASTASHRCAGPRVSIGIGISGLSQRQRRGHAKHRQRQSQGLSQRSYHSFFSFAKEVMFLRRLASDLAPLPMGLRLLTPVSVQTLCQRSRAAGVRVCHHVGQPRPDAVVGACEAVGIRRARPAVHRRTTGDARPHEPIAVTIWCHKPTCWQRPAAPHTPRGLPRPPRAANSCCGHNIRYRRRVRFPLA